MSGITDAFTVVRVARRRLLAVAGADGAAAGALLGAAAGVTVGVLGLLTGASAVGTWLLALPVVGATLGAAAAMRRAPSLVGSALALDRAAGTHEAFVSAISAEDAEPAFRALSADHALARCDRRAVGRFLPFRVPPRAAPAVVAIALLTVLALVTAPGLGAAHSSGRGSTGSGGETGGGTGTGPGGGPDGTPTPASASSLAPADRAPVGAAEAEDLRLAPDSRLREIAERLAGAGSAAAAEALAALAGGDREGALEALGRALGSRTDGAGPGGGAARGASARGDTRVPWSVGSWPLRYDRTVGRWFELTGRGAAPAGDERR